MGLRTDLLPNMGCWTASRHACIQPRARPEDGLCQSIINDPKPAGHASMHEHTQTCQRAAVLPHFPAAAETERGLGPYCSLLKTEAAQLITAVRHLSCHSLQPNSSVTEETVFKTIVAPPPPTSSILAWDSIRQALTLRCVQNQIPKLNLGG